MGCPTLCSLAPSSPPAKSLSRMNETPLMGKRECTATLTCPVMRGEFKYTMCSGALVTLILIPHTNIWIWITRGLSWKCQDTVQHERVKGNGITEDCHWHLIFFLTSQRYKIPEKWMAGNRNPPYHLTQVQEQFQHIPRTVMQFYETHAARMFAIFSCPFLLRAGQTAIKWPGSWQ